jgi:hypothetical protein
VVSGRRPTWRLSRAVGPSRLLGAQAGWQTTPILSRADLATPREARGDRGVRRDVRGAAGARAQLDASGNIVMEV